MTDYQVVETMITYGGGFEVLLAQAFRCADRCNQERLRIAFPDIWQKYQRIAEGQERIAAERSA